MRQSLPSILQACYEGVEVEHHKQSLPELHLADIEPGLAEMRFSQVGRLRSAPRHASVRVPGRSAQRTFRDRERNRVRGIHSS